MKTQIFIRTGILLLLAGFLLATPLPAFADTCTWDGSDGKWSNAKKWSCGHAPGKSDTAIINDGTVTLTQSTDVGTLNLRGGEVTGDFLDIHAVLNWSGGWMTGTGGTVIETGAVANLKGDFKGLDRFLFNVGTVNWIKGPIFLDEHAGIVNAKDRLFDVQGDLIVRSRSRKPKFKNYGTLRKSAGGSSLEIAVPFINDKDGVVEVRVGEIEFKYGGELEGNFNIASGAQVRFVELRYTLLQTKFAGDGEVVVLEYATLEMDDLGGAIGKVEIDNLVLSGGILTGDDVRIAKHLDWRAGTMAGSGTTYANGATTFRSAGEKLLERKFENAGTATWAGGDIELVGSGAVFNNLASGVLDIRADQYLAADTGGQFNNAGIVRKSAGAGSAVIDAPFNNSGTVDARAGTLKFSASYNQTAGAAVLNGGDLKFNTPMQLQGGTLSGAGAIKGSVNNSGGTVTPGASAGVLEIIKDYTQGAGGALDIELGGLKAGSGFDQLGIGGNATLGGTLNLSTVGGYTPNVGDSFKIMTLLGTRTGTFATVNGADLGGGNSFKVNYGASEVTLTVQGAAATTRVSVASDGTQTNDSLTESPSISADGRYVAFASRARNLVSGDTNGHEDVFVHDRFTGDTTLVSLAPAGGQIGESKYPSISADGRYVAFQAMQPGAAGWYYAIFVHDRATGQTTVISRYPDGSVGTGGDPSISASGGYVAFESLSTLDPDDTNGPPYYDIYLYERATQQLTWVTRGANRDSYSPHLSTDGRYLAFSSDATNLVSNPSGNWQTLVWDRTTKQFSLVSVASDGTHANGNAGAWGISDDGRYVVFVSNATNLGCGAQYGTDVFLHDRQTGQTTCVSVTPDGTPGYGDSYDASISGDGRYVAFEHDADDLTPGDTNRMGDIFVRDLQTGRTTRASLAHDGAQANGYSWDTSISRDGRYVAFTSGASNLVPGDTNGYQDIFVRDRQGDIASCDEKPAKPTLLSPADGADVTKARVPLDWNDVACAIKYKVVVRQDSKTGTVADRKNNLTSSAYTTEPLTRGKTYWWQVEACNAQGCTESRWQSFYVKPAE
ncbi:MAG: PD40 domain-containing protein [Chloroflexi bacterium]|nr:PD40 domain-containing protein [Chloroflexota bacterium]